MPSEHEPRAVAPSADRPSFTPDSTAASLGIPLEQREHPTVRQFLALVNRVENLQSDCSRAQSERSAIPDPAAGGISPSLAERYETAELLLRAVHAVLTDRLNGAAPLAENPGYVKGKLNAALGRYGLEVVARPAAGNRESADRL